MGGAIPTGGAARGVLNLHRGLLSRGVDSHILFGRTLDNQLAVLGAEESLVARWKGRFWRKWERLLNKLYGVRPGSSFSLGWHGHDIAEAAMQLRPDIINIHWPHLGILEFTSLAKLKIPVVWTIRDFWAFTGGCHYALGCREFTRDCADCPYVTRFSSWQPTARMARRKTELYKKIDIAFVAISPWEADLARQSSVLRDCRIKMIPNCVDLRDFRPHEKSQARQALGLRPHGTIYAVGAYSLGSEYKGTKVLAEIATNLASDTLLLSFGLDPIAELRERSAAKHFGFISDQKQLELIYSAADVFLCTSMEEVFGKTVIEAMSCGTPAVVFKDGGMASLLTVADGIEIADTYSGNSFLQAADRLLARRARDAEFSERLHAAIRQFESGAVASHYVELYEKEIEAYRQKKNPLS